MKHSFPGGAQLRAPLAIPALALCAFVLCAPAWAQGNAATSAPATRVQVKAELAELVAAGYNPRDWYHYPDNLWAAQRIVEQRHAALAQAAPASTPHTQDASKATAAATGIDESMGGVPAATSASGGPAGAAGAGQTGRSNGYGAPCGHGPQCNVFFGR